MYTDPSKKVIYLKYIYFKLSIVQIYQNLLTYRSRLTAVKIIIKLYLEYLCTFLDIKPKMCFNVTIDEDYMIFE